MFTPKTSTANLYAPIGTVRGSAEDQIIEGCARLRVPLPLVVWDFRRTLSMATVWGPGKTLGGLWTTYGTAPKFNQFEGMVCSGNGHYYYQNFSSPLGINTNPLSVMCIGRVAAANVGNAWSYMYDYAWDGWWGTQTGLQSIYNNSFNSSMGALNAAIGYQGQIQSQAATFANSSWCEGWFNAADYQSDNVVTQPRNLTRTMAVGGFNGASGYTNYFTGSIAALIFWNVQLTKDQLYRLTREPYALISPNPIRARVFPSNARPFVFGANQMRHHSMLMGPR